MYDNMTWKDENGAIMTKATKAKLAERLYSLEQFLWACTSCRVEKHHVSIVAKLMKVPNASDSASIQNFWRNDIARQIKNYRLARRKRNNMYAVLNRDAAEEDVPYEHIEPRSLNREQAKRLMAVLRDNGIEPNECMTVAEAICYVTDLDESMLQEVENEQ